MLSCFVSLNISLGDSSSLEMAPFDRSHTSSYRRSNVGRILYRFFWKIAILFIRHLHSTRTLRGSELPVGILP